MPINEYDQPIGEPVTDWSPRPPVRPVTLTGRTCVVEPLAAAHVDGLHDALVERSGPQLWTYLPHGPFTDRAGFTAYVESVGVMPGLTPFVVLDGAGAPLGVLSYLRNDPAQGSVEVGHVVLSEVLQRSTLATEAQFLLMQHVFDDLGYRRYEWKCDSLNGPSRKAAARLGFRHEGRFSKALVYKGRNRDTDWFAITDDDWPRLKKAYDTWLAPSNFDAAGRQRTSLADLTNES
jgi:RimJ/RimL family protein N-acetyltransferase